MPDPYPARTIAHTRLNMARPEPDVEEVTPDPALGVPAPRRRTVVLPGAEGTPAEEPATFDADGVPAIAGLEVVAELGRGAGSVVHHVRRDGADHVLKVLPARPDPESVLAAWRREAALLAMVGDPAIPLIHEVGVVGACPYLVTDLVPGLPLAEILALGPLPPASVRALAVDLARVLAAVHRRGLVHGDVKPENVVVDPDGVAHLIDFGPAGTPGRAVDRRSDLSSLGAVLLRSLAGRTQFEAADDLADVVARLLTEDPDVRYPTASALLADLGANEAQGADDADLPLCGRDSDLARLGDRWRRARAGSGGAALVSGEAGTGTSRLAREVVASARVGRGVVLQATCSPGDQAPLAALRAAVDGYVREITGLPDHARAPHVEAVRGAAGSLAPLLAEVFGELAGLLGVERLPTADRRADRQADRQDPLPLAVADFLAGLARSSGGLLLHLDDVHRLDPASRQVVRELAGRLPTTPLLLLATARSEAEHADGVAAFRAVLAPDVDVALGPLGTEDLREFVAVMLPGVGGRASIPTAPADRLVRRLAGPGGGNPLLVQEYLRAAVDAGLLRPGWNGWELDEAGLEALGLPRDVRGLVLRRVEGIGGRARQFLTTAAATGPEFTAGPVAAVHGVPEADVADVLAEAVARRLLGRRPDGRHRFVHDLIRESLLAGPAPDDEVPSAALPPSG